MAKDKKLNYKSGLEILMKTSFPSEKVNNGGLKLISDLLNEVNSLMIYHIETEYSSANKVGTHTFQHCARNAIGENFPGKLKENALSEAFKQLALLESCCIVYGKVGTKIKGKTPNPEDIELGRINDEISLFKKGIGTLFSATSSQYKIDSKALAPMALCIYEFGKSVAKRVSERAGQKEELQLRDLEKVLPEYFGVNTLKVCLGEAHRCLAMYENGLIEFEPKRRYDVFLPQEKETMLSKAFKPGIESLLNEIAPSIEPEGRTKRYLVHILTEMAQYLAENASEACRKKKLLEIKYGDIHQSIGESFPLELKRHAQIKGIQNVVAFHRDLIPYERKSPEPGKLGSKSTRIRSQQQARSSLMVEPKNQAKINASSPDAKQRSNITVSMKTSENSPIPKRIHSINSPKSLAPSKKLRSESPPNHTKPINEATEKMKPAKAMMSGAGESFSSINVNLSREASGYLDQILRDLCKVLINDTVSQVKNSQIHKEDIERVLRRFFSPTLATHALLSAYNLSKFSKSK